MLGEIDRPHPAATEHVFDDVAADAESLVAAGKQLMRLEAREQALGHELRGGLLRLIGKPQVRERSQPVRREKAALAQQIDKLGGQSGGGGHGRT